MRGSVREADADSSHEKRYVEGSFEADPRNLQGLTSLLPSAAFPGECLVLNTTCPISVGKERAGIATRTQQNRGVLSDTEY